MQAFQKVHQSTCTASSAHLPADHTTLASSSSSAASRLQLAVNFSMLPGHSSSPEPSQDSTLLFQGQKPHRGRDFHLCAALQSPPYHCALSPSVQRMPEGL